MEFTYIINPETGRRVKTSGIIGKRILKKYIMQVGGGGRRKGKQSARGGAFPDNVQKTFWNNMAIDQKCQLCAELKELDQTDPMKSCTAYNKKLEKEKSEKEAKLKLKLDGLKAELHQAKLLLMQGLTEEACTIYKDLSETNFEESGARGAIYNNNGVCCLHRSDLENAKDWFQRGLRNTIHSRHLRTLHGNQNELLRALKEDPEKAKGYSGKHSLIF